jgi:hypothetical protein
MKLHFEICSDLYVAGRNEDGQDFTAEVYFITATDERGNRWRHGHVFPGCRPEVSEDPDGGYCCTHFNDVRNEAMAEAERLLNRIETAGKVNLDHWREDRPMYGSRACVEYGQYDDWMEERREQFA